jgi:Rrf2 family protein
MRISMKADYAVRAVVDLGHRYGQGLVQSAEIAKRQHIPEAYLDQLLTALRKAGIVRSIRGPQGGHELARAPDQITMEVVVSTLEGPFLPVECLENVAFCNLVPGCGQREVWQDVRQAVSTILDSHTIADLVAREKERRERIVYYI